VQQTGGRPPERQVLSATGALLPCSPGRIAMFLNEAQISLTGYVATQPVTRTVKSGATSTSMRVAWTPRRQDRVTGEWVDGNTSYVTVICWRKLATNAGLCVRKGDPVIVKGRLSIRPYEDKQGVQRTAVEVEANSVGTGVYLLCAWVIALLMGLVERRTRIPGLIRRERS